MNRAYIGKLMELAEKDTNVLHLLADSGTGLDEMFKKYFPDQMLNFGIGEENMVAAAAGLASAGKKPFVFTAGAFLAYRALEFIRDDICLQNLNVKLVGMGSGLSWSSLGPTHHTTEDVSVLRSIPNLMILSPGTPRQVALCVEQAYLHNGPVYIKIGMNGETEYFKDDYKLDTRQGDILCDGDDAVIYVTGSILEEARKAVELLKNDGLNVALINVVGIKPFCDSIVTAKHTKTNRIFTVEEHNIYGGLGSIVAEAVAYHGLKSKVIPIGINDFFATGYGTHQKVRTCNKLNALSIYKRIREELM